MGRSTLSGNDLVHIPASHTDLIDRPLFVALTTVMPDGSPQTTPVWCNRDGDLILLNSMREFRKQKNMRLNPKVALLVYDPANPARYIAVQGLVVEMTEDGALEHLDVLTQLYSNKPDAKFFGDSVPAELEGRFHPVKITVQPMHIRVEG